MTPIRIKNNPGRWFLLAALVFGGLYALLIPPFQSPDEPNHLLRAYQVSEGHFLPDRTPDNRLGGVLPASLQQVADSFAYLKNHDEARLRPGLIGRAGRIPLEDSNRRFSDFANTAVYAPTAYVPQALAIAVLRPLGASPLMLLYGCRLLNLWIWCLLVFLAIRWMPGQARSIAMLAMFPASLVMAASCNADVITNGLCWWMVAAACRGSLYKPASAALGLLVVVLNKLVTLPFALLQFWHRPEGRRARILSAGLVLAAGCVAVGWGRLSQQYFIPYDAYHPAFRDGQTLNEGVQPAAQLAYVWAHPVAFAQTMLMSFARAVPSVGAHLVGKFGWEKNYIPGFAVVLIWLVFAAFLQGEVNPATARQRLLAGLIAGCYVLMFAVTMYALWCPVGASEISNLQGRYFVPVLPLLVVATGGDWLGRYQRYMIPVAAVVLFAGQLAMLASIWQRYDAL
jgi:hypothetical protein